MCAVAIATSLHTFLSQAITYRHKRFWKYSVRIFFLCKTLFTATVVETCCRLHVTTFFVFFRHVPTLQ